MLIVFDRIRLNEASGYPQNGGRISMRALLLDPLRNRLLAALPQPDFALIARHLATTSMPPGLVLNEVDDSVHQVYFPIKGMLSLLAILGNGKAIETATVGREGVVNAMAGLGLLRSNVRVDSARES
jgi:CRP-like cAMP-binding protein